MLNKLAFDEPLDTPLYTCDVENFYEQPELCFSGLGSPCFRSILYASILRKGKNLVNGYGKPIEIKLEDKEQILFKADLGINFEKIRRNEFSHKPSRMSSVFVVEDSWEGRLCLSQMFYQGYSSGKYAPFIFNVKVVVCLFSHKGDIQWLDEYRETQNVECIREYWRGNAFNSSPIYEYFLEGTIIPNNREQILEIRKQNADILGGWSQQHWRNLNELEFKLWFDNK